MRHDAQHLLVAPHVIFERRDVEIADENGALGRRRAQRRRVTHLIEESKLMGKFRIYRRVGNIAAGWDIEVMHGDGIAQPGALAEHRGDMAAVALAAELLNTEIFERQAR